MAQPPSSPQGNEPEKKERWIHLYWSRSWAHRKCCTSHTAHLKNPAPQLWRSGGQGWLGESCKSSKKELLSPKISVHDSAMISSVHVSSVSHHMNSHGGQRSRLPCGTRRGYVQDCVLEARVNVFVIGLVLHGYQCVTRRTKGLFDRVSHLIPHTTCMKSKVR